MLLIVFISTLFLVVHCDTQCFFDIKKLRCWCRDDNNVTIFRIVHEKSDDKWSVNFNPTNEKCDPESIKDLFPTSWNGKGENTTDTGSGCCQVLVTKPGYQQIGCSLYKLYTEGTYWDQARRTCMLDETHLAIINSDIEAAFLAILLRSNRNNIVRVETTDSAFIGFHDMFEEGEFLTIFGQPLKKTGFSIWANGKPDNRKHPDYDYIGLPGNDCGGLSVSGTLTDVGCDWHHAFICEIEISSFTQTNHKSTTEVDYSRGAFPGIELTKPQRPPPTKKPGFGYLHYPGLNFYRYHTTPTLWDNARITCEKEGAYLAIANSAKEFYLLATIEHKVAKEFLVGSYHNRYTFLGHHCLFKIRDFITIFNETISDGLGTLVNYDNKWASEQYVGENCGCIDLRTDFGDVDCHMHNAFICEKDILEEGLELSTREGFDALTPT